MFTQHEISLDEHRNWFAVAGNDPTRRLLIVEEDRDPIGYVQFNNVAMDGVADWGFYARPDAPKRSGAKLGAMALNHAFGAIGLHKVCGQAMEANLASIAFHKRLGFVQEGVLRDQKLVDGLYRTLICFGLLAHEWRFG